MSQPLTLIGTLLNADTTGATGTLSFEIIRYATVSVVDGGPLGITQQAPVVVPIVNGSIVGTHTIYGNDSIDGQSWYNVSFVDKNGSTTFKWFVFDNGSSQFDIGTAIDQNVPDRLTSLWPNLDLCGCDSVVVGGDVNNNGAMSVATIVFTLGQLEAMRNDDGPNHNGTGSGIIVVNAPTPNEIVIPWFRVFTCGPGSRPSGGTNLQLFTDNPDFGAWGDAPVSSVDIVNFAPSLFASTINEVQNNGTDDNLSNFQGLAMYFGRPNNNDEVSGGTTSMIINLTVYYTVVSR